MTRIRSPTDRRPGFLNSAPTSENYVLNSLVGTQIAQGIHVLAGRDDRFFPIEFQRRVARERLGKEVQQVPGGLLVVLSNAEGLTARVLAYVKDSRDIGL